MSAFLETKYSPTVYLKSAVLALATSPFVIVVFNAPSFQVTNMCFLVTFRFLIVDIATNVNDISCIC